MKKEQLETELRLTQQKVADLEHQLARNVNERQFAEKILEESSGRFHTLFETMAQGVVFQDADGIITHGQPGG